LHHRGPVVGKAINDGVCAMTTTTVRDYIGGLLEVLGVRL